MINDDDLLKTRLQQINSGTVPQNATSLNALDNNSNTTLEYQIAYAQFSNSAQQNSNIQNNIGQLQESNPIINFNFESSLSDFDGNVKKIDNGWYREITNKISDLSEKKRKSKHNEGATKILKMKDEKEKMLKELDRLYSDLIGIKNSIFSAYDSLKDAKRNLSEQVVDSNKSIISEQCDIIQQHIDSLDESLRIINNFILKITTK
ncbi:MAG: hypothetical protein Q4E39_01190 [bacterium]|nr:hypothetical protein [bacterium]